jgi:hypothetical protein
VSSHLALAQKRGTAAHLPCPLHQEVYSTDWCAEYYLFETQISTNPALK